MGTQEDAHWTIEIVRIAGNFRSTLTPKGIGTQESIEVEMLFEKNTEIKERIVEFLEGFNYFKAKIKPKGKEMKEIKNHMLRFDGGEKSERNRA